MILSPPRCTWRHLSRIVLASHHAGREGPFTVAEDKTRVIQKEFSRLIHMLVCNGFKLESPNLYQICIFGFSQLVLKMGLLTLTIKVIWPFRLRISSLFLVSSISQLALRIGLDMMEASVVFQQIVKHSSRTVCCYAWWDKKNGWTEIHTHKTMVLVLFDHDSLQATGLDA